MAFVANPMVISSYLANSFPVLLASGSVRFPLQFPSTMEVTGLGAPRCACGLELLDGRFFRSYRSKSSESNPRHGLVAWSTSVRLRRRYAKQHPDSHLHLSPERSNLTHSVFRRMESTGTWNSLGPMCCLFSSRFYVQPRPPSSPPRIRLHLCRKRRRNL